MFCNSVEVAYAGRAASHAHLHMALRARRQLLPAAVALTFTLHHELLERRTAPWIHRCLAKTRSWWGFTYIALGADSTVRCCERISGCLFRCCPPTEAAKRHACVVQICPLAVRELLHSWIASVWRLDNPPCRGLMVRGAGTVGSYVR